MFNRLFQGSSTSPGQLAIKSADPGSLYVNQELRRDAAKSIALSQEALDFINDTSVFQGGNYSERQLEQAYRISGYLFASLRLVDLLIRTVPVAAEKAQGTDWKRLPETHSLNRLFQREGGKLLSRMFLFNAVYGNVLVYKRKTRKAAIGERVGKPLPYFHQGGVSGFHIIPNMNWELEEDTLNGKVTGFMLSQADPAVGRGRSRLLRRECVYHNEFDLREPNRGMSLVSRAIHDAITDSAISRWVAHYFLSGALPLLLVAPEEDNPMRVGESDLSRYKNQIEKAWLGVYGEYALRAKFTDRRLNVQQVGIDADKVTAPDLDRKALNKITAIIGLTADLVVPPEGGSDNARHKFLIHQAWEQAVLPPVQEFLDCFTEDLGLHKAGMRLVVDRQKIPALQSDRGDVSQTELGIYSGGVQTFGETRQKIQQDENEALKALENFLIVEGKPQSVGRIVRNDRMPSDALLSSIQGGWESGLLRKSWALKLGYNIKLPKSDKDGYKYEVVPEPGGGGGFGSPGESPAEPETPDDNPPAPPTTPQPEGGKETESQTETPKTSVPASNGTPADTTTAATTKPTPDSPADKASGTQTAGDGSTLVETEVVQGNPLVPDDIQVTDETFGDVLDVPEFEPDVSQDDDLRVGQEAYASIWMGNDVQLERVFELIQDRLAKVPGIQFSNCQDLHITLTYAEDVPDDIFERIHKLMPLALDALTLRLGPLVTFTSHTGQQVIALAVELSDALLDAHQRVYGAFSVYGLDLSVFSDPARWMPHVTLAYAPADSQVPDFLTSFTVMPPCIRFQRDDYETVYQVPLTGQWRSETQGLKEGWGPTYDALASDTVDQPVNQQTVEDLWDMTLMFRQKWTRALERWKISGEVPRVLPSRIANAVGDCLTNSRDDIEKQQVFVAATRAVENGDFDEHVVMDDNPVAKALDQPEKEKAMQDTPEDELRAWEKKAMGSKNVKSVADKFEVNQLPGHLETDVRAGLSAAENKEDIKAVFRAVRAAFTTEYTPPPTSEDMLTQVAERMAEIGDEDLVKALDVPDDEDES